MAALEKQTPALAAMDTDQLIPRAKALACLGRHADAAALAETFSQQAPSDPESLYQAAVIYAACRTSAWRLQHCDFGAAKPDGR